MPSGNPSGKRVVGIVLYVVGFCIALAGAGLMVFRNELYHSHGVVIVPMVGIAVIAAGAVVTIVGDVLRRKARKDSSD